MAITLRDVLTASFLSSCIFQGLPGEHGIPGKQGVKGEKVEFRFHICILFKQIERKDPNAVEEAQDFKA